MIEQFNNYVEACFDLLVFAYLLLVDILAYFPLVDFQFPLLQFGIITHEVGHALGFFHTQSRVDRDSFVTLNLNNVPLAARHNFNKVMMSILSRLHQVYRIVFGNASSELPFSGLGIFWFFQLLHFFFVIYVDDPF